MDWGVLVNLKGIHALTLSLGLWRADIPAELFLLAAGARSVLFGLNLSLLLNCNGKKT